MKNMKKLLSLVLAMVMVFAMTISASAAGEYSITINNTNEEISIDGKVYTAYKVFDVTYNTEKTAYSYTIAKEFENFSYVVGDTTYSGAALVTYIQGLTANSDELFNVAEALLAYATGTPGVAAAGTATAANQKAEITLNEAGYYLVTGTANATSDADQTVTAACILTTTDPAATVNVKADVPSIDKVIVNADSANGQDGNGTAVNVGDVVNFKVTSTVPDMTGYDTYTFIFNDTMSDGLTPVDTDDDGKIDVTITIDGQPYTGFDVTQNGQSFTVTFNDFIAQANNAGKEIVITYAATLNEKALTTDVETNKVNLTYSNNPNDDTSKETTPDEIVYVYDFDIVIDKFAADETEDTEDNIRLAGAEFVLYKVVENVKYYYHCDETTKEVTWVALGADETVEAAITAGKITEVVTDDTGAARFTGLDAGKYYLEETKAPDGYNMLEAPVEVTITATYKDNGTINETNTTKEENGQYYLEKGIENNTGTILPSTGGMGTTLFYVVGGLLVLVAVVMLVTRKRMDREA